MNAVNTRSRGESSNHYPFRVMMAETVFSDVYSTRFLPVRESLALLMLLWFGANIHTGRKYYISIRG